MKTENKILKYLYGESYKDSFYDDVRKDIKRILKYDVNCEGGENEE